MRAEVHGGPDGPPVVDEQTLRADVVVVGGGATGCATTYHLARAGADVLLLERYDLNAEASGRNAGSLHGQIQYEPFQHEGEQWARDFLPALRFLADSLELWGVLSEELGVDLEVKREGGLLVADDPVHLPAIERKVTLEQRAGINSRMLNATELRELAPWVTPRAIGGELCPIEGKANPLVIAPAFANRAEEHGARVRTRVEVLSVARDGAGYLLITSRGPVRAGKVVLATGDAMCRMGADLGLHLPVSSEAVQVNVTEPVAPMVEHLVYYAGDRLTFKQARAGGLLIGGGWPARRDAAGQWVLDPDSLRRNIRVAIQVAPAIASLKLIRTWVGVGNGTPDQRPIVGAVRSLPGLYVGLFPYMGLTASPLMGRLLCRLVLGQDPERDLASFTPERFA